MTILKSIGYLILLYAGMFVVALGVASTTPASLATLAVASTVGTVVSIVGIFVGVSLEVLYGIPKIPAQIVVVILAVGSVCLTIFSA